MTNDGDQVAVPLPELLREVPASLRVRIDDGPFHSTYIPVGSLCHEAADRIDALAREASMLREDCAIHLAGANEFSEKWAQAQARAEKAEAELAAHDERRKDRE